MPESDRQLMMKHSLTETLYTVCDDWYYANHQNGQ